MSTNTTFQVGDFVRWDCPWVTNFDNSVGIIVGKKTYPHTTNCAYSIKWIVGRALKGCFLCAESNLKPYEG